MIGFILFIIATSPGSIAATLKSTSRIVTCDDAKPVLVRVPLGRVTVLNFPLSPKEILPGEGGFDFKTIRQDLVIKILKPGSETNLFVYLDGRKCLFHVREGKPGDETLSVRDPLDQSVEVRFVEK